MKSREELLRESASNPSGMAEYAFTLQEQLAEKEQLLAEARAYIAEREARLRARDVWELEGEERAAAAGE